MTWKLRRQTHSAALAGIIICTTMTPLSAVSAQEVRYSWFDIGFVSQDVSRTGTLFDAIGGQTVTLDAQDGSGVRFRGSIGTWKNFFVAFDYSSADLDVDAVVSNSQGDFAAQDEFDFTVIRGSLGYRFPIRYNIDIVGELSYESIDYDFGNFVPNIDFDVDGQDVGGLLGLRAMASDNLELRAHARYSNVGDVNLTTKEFDSDVLFGAGLGYTLIRGLSLTLDYETGEVETWSIGFRLDLDED